MTRLVLHPGGGIDFLPLSSRHRKGVVGSLPGPEAHLPQHQRTSRKQWLADNAEAQRDYHRAYRERNRERLNAQRARRLREIRDEGIAHYGGRCECCGEDEPRFLTLEHRDRQPGDRTTGMKAWSKAKSAGWPDTHTVLCFNCNCAKGVYGECPHRS